MNLSYYKKNQGSVVRASTGILLLIIIAYGCYALYRFISPIDLSTNPPQPTFWGTTIPYLSIDFFDFSVTYGMLISLGLFVILSFITYLWVFNKPRTADFLIETEGELKKVSWPSRQQWSGSSMAVIISVVILGAFLLVIDRLFYFLMKLIKLF